MKKVKYTNGAIYSGGFKDGKQNGQGTESYPDGSSRSGKWENCEFIG